MYSDGLLLYFNRSENSISIFKLLSQPTKANKKKKLQTARNCSKTGNYTIAKIFFTLESKLRRATA